MNSRKFEKWRGLTNYDMNLVVFDVKTTNLTTIDTNKHYNCIYLRSRFKFLQKQARTRYMIQNSYCNDSRHIWRKMNGLKLAIDQDLTIRNKNYTKETKIEEELNQNLNLERRRKWRQNGGKLDSNFHSIQARFGQTKLIRCSNSINKR